MASLYIHIPFCERKCFYCSFVVAVGQRHKVDLYLDCLRKEAQNYQGTPVKTLYWGGGTPSFLDNDQLLKLFDIVYKNFLFEPGIEWTIEVNPEGVDAGKVKLLKDHGVNRVSLGVQSLNDRFLNYLGRNHDRQKALATYALLRDSGFNNINLDLMYSFPNQSLRELEEDVLELSRLGSEHLSLYSLTIEENSRFYTKKVALSDQERQREDYLLILHALAQRNFHQYEISNFAKSNRESKHNINYWVGGNYIGLGVGAHSHRDGQRFWNVQRFATYLARMRDGLDPCEEKETVDRVLRFKETLLIGLRMNQGVHVDSLQERFDGLLDIETQEIIDQFIQEGFLIMEKGYLKTTPRGRLVLDELSAKLI